MTHVMHLAQYASHRRQVHHNQRIMLSLGPAHLLGQPKNLHPVRKRRAPSRRALERAPHAFAIPDHSNNVLPPHWVCSRSKLDLRFVNFAVNQSANPDCGSTRAA